METLILILKSAACLAVLMVFYKLFLENLAIHKLKRFYLLGALVVSIVIPFITFIKYVEPTFNVPYFNLDHSAPLGLLPVEELVVSEPTNYLQIILWSIYGLGVLLFASKFCINLYSIVSKINKNEKQKHNNFISVLLNDLIVPHTFFSYIFLNKTKFEAKAIPQEVILHEQTHASQKHSLDILFIELFQIVFWFNPLLYFIKKNIKLNHEFLADDAVLKQGTDSSTYQKILLQFTANANEIQLANAINYSLIKKRFTIMKTQTSKKAVWLRSLLLIPLLGGLLFSFSGREQVEKEVVPAMEIKSNPSSFNNQELQTISNEDLSDYINPYFPLTTDKEKEDFKNLVNTQVLKSKNETTARSIDIKVLNNGTYKIDGIKANKSTFLKVVYNLHQDISKETRNNIINVHVDSPKAISDKEVWFIYNNLLDYGFNRIVAYNQEIIRAKGNTPFAIESDNSQEYSSEKLKKSTLTVNGIVCDGCQLNLSRNGIANIILGTTTGDNILSFNIKFPKKPTVNIKGNTLNAKAQVYLSKSNLGDVITLFHLKAEKREKLSHVTITLVDKNNKNYSNSPIVKKGEKSMLPPPPPAPPKVKKGEISNIPPPPNPPTAIEVAEYNTWSKKINSETINITNDAKWIPPVDEKKLTKYISIYKRMTMEQKAHSEKMPFTGIELKKGDPPPPPPPPAAPQGPPTKKEILNGVSGFSKYILQMEKNGDAIFYNNKKTTAKEAIALYKTYGKLDMLTKMIEKGKYQVYLSKSKGEESIIIAKDLTKNNTSNIPPPPPPKSTIDHIVSMAKKGASFYYNGKSISSDKAIAIVKNNSEININSQTKNGKRIVKLSEKGIKTENEKGIRQVAVSEKKENPWNIQMRVEEVDPNSKPDLSIGNKKYLKVMAEKGAQFYFEKEKIDLETAITNVDKYKQLFMSTVKDINENITVIQFKDYESRY